MESFGQNLGRVLRAEGVTVLGGPRSVKVALLRGPTGGYLAMYWLGRNVKWWGPVPHVCADVHNTTVGKSWLRWALVLVDESNGGFVVDDMYFQRHHRHWPLGYAGRVNEHYLLKPDNLHGAAEFAGPKTCVRILMAMLRDLPPGPDGVGPEIIAGGRYVWRARRPEATAEASPTAQA